MSGDYVDEILNRAVAGIEEESVEGDDVGLDFETSQFIDRSVAGLVEIGAIDGEVGARATKKVIKRGVMAGRASQPTRTAAPAGAPRAAAATNNQGGRAVANPQFSRSSRELERRAPLGFTQDGTGSTSFALAASIGATVTMRAKVSRPCAIDRLLILADKSGAVIDSLQIGDEEQSLARGVPVELYGKEALTDNVPDNFTPLTAGLDVIITLRNTTATAISGTIGAKCIVQR